MASQKQLIQRMKTIQTIGKVTKAMKMIASTRVKTVTAQLENARAFQEELTQLLKPENNSDKQLEKGGNWLLMPVGADRGLCGAINSAVSRESRRLYAQNAASTTPKLAVVGTRVVAGLQRLFEKNIQLVVSDQKPGKRMTFKQVSVIADLVRRLEWTRADVVFNRFKNAITYITTTETLNRTDFFAKFVPEYLLPYNLEGDSDIWANLDEFRMLVRFWHIWAESETSEITARVAAMEGSNKAAKDMYIALQLKANKLRQAKITLEICDIVAGAESATE